MSSDDQPKGIATEGYPKGPEIPDKSQLGKGQPGVQADMESQPITTGLPTQHGQQDVLTVEDYVGVGKLKGRVVIVTGGDSGIGRSVAVMMAKEKAKAIAIVYLPKEQQDADDTAKMLEKEGTDAVLLAEDLSQGEQVCKKIVDEMVSKYGKIDILVNNAAIQHIVPSVTETTPEILESTFKTNIFPMFYLAKYAVPHMPRGSSIINSTSVTAYQGSPSLLEYSSTKGAIVAFTRSLSKQLAPKGIRVNAVAPGPIWTPLQPATMPDEKLEATKSSSPPLGRIGQIQTPLNPASREQDNLEKWLEKEPPLGRLGQPAECGPSYVFLASQEASYYSGQVLHPNGGYVING
ncbi:hypothetical protein N2152v2_005732 [Parachlorella kessleri]